jgi:hypothetical protein
MAGDLGAAAIIDDLDAVGVYSGLPFYLHLGKTSV